jgi:hypothetical protein
MAGPYLAWQKFAEAKRETQMKWLKPRRSLKKFGQKPISRLPLRVFASRRCDSLRTETKPTLSQAEGETYSFA